MDEAAKYAGEDWNKIFVAVLGQHGAAAAWIAVAALIALVGATSRYYTGLLAGGGASEGSDERRDYDALRANLGAGGWATQVYNLALTRLIARVDIFFNDADKAELSASPRAFGLKTAAPLWTGASYDRCLLLALVYPAGLIFVIWALTGQSGPAEHALDLLSNVSDCERFKLLISNIFIIWTVRNIRVSGSISSTVAWTLVSIATFTVAGSASFVFVFAGGLVAPGAVAVATAVISTIFFIMAFHAANACAIDTDFPFWFASALSIALALLVLKSGKLISKFFTNCHRQGLVVAHFTVTTVALVLVCSDKSPLFLSDWPEVGALLLFLGLLTMVNAPFDWISIGLTRALLRLGVQKKGLWPYGLAFLDLLLALVLVALLAGAMIVAVQGFDDLSTSAGSASILNSAALLHGMRQNPGSSEYWWVYATLFSTLIPSMSNMVLGGWSLTRGIPWLSLSIFGMLPEGRSPPVYNRVRIAAVLTAQWVIGGILTLAATGLLFEGVYALFPRVGHVFLDGAEALVALNLPALLLHW